MKYHLIAASAAVASVAAANSHRHQHRHLHEQRDLSTETEVIATATIYEIQGSAISKEDACEGVEDGEYTWKNPADATVCTSTATAASTAAAFYPASSSWSDWSSSSSTSAPPPPAAPSQAAPTTGSWNDWSKGVDSPFPDGTLECSTFPSDYGAVPIPYLNMGGWSGIQKVTIAGGMVNHIVTGISGDGCSEGDMCSYACPPGYQKAHWPSTQGATGQSVGGITCSGGKLKLTNPALSKSLCIKGTGGVKAQNNANAVVAICRTDYPGTESETIPVELQPGETKELACPDAGSYYQWTGKSTSAQYYLNPIGVPAEKGCKWGDGSSTIGNWAPINFGVGYKDGKTWLSIFQNKPTTLAQYQGTVEIKGNLSGSCKYQNGQYCGVTGCNADGCTVSVLSGEATYVVSN